jgi:AraC-like DNA-binding protein
MVLIPDHQLFHCLGLQPTSSLWMHFSFDRRPAPDQAIPILLSPDSTELGLLDAIRALTESGDEDQHDRVYRLSTALLNVVLSRPEIRWRPAIPNRLAHLINFIEDHVREKIPNTRLARLAGISVEGIYRLFRHHMGTSPSQYISQVRIRKASHLLQKPDLSIDTIAEHTGFPNRAYFSRVFKQVTGVSPAAFRSSHTFN